MKLDLFKPDEYNIRKSTLRPVRAIDSALLDGGRTELELLLLKKNCSDRAARVPELGWTVVGFFAQ